MFAIVAMVVSAQVRPAVAAEPAALAGNMITSVNEVRAQHGLAPLAEVGVLEELATERSVDMATRQYFSHTTPEGVDVFAMMDQRGISYSTAGENLAWNTHGDDVTAWVAVDGWKTSPPHADNMFNGGFSRAGIGVVSRDDGQKIFTLILVAD